MRAYAQQPGIQRENFDPREFEVGFQSPLDPYSNTKIFVSFENGEVSIEEGYAYWTGLPGHIRFDIGKFRQQFGELNRWHLHALPRCPRPNTPSRSAPTWAATAWPAPASRCTARSAGSARTS